MCGIVGGINYETAAMMSNSLNIIMQMLHADAVRGMHGTGLYAVDREGYNMRVRVGGPPYELVGSKDFEKFQKFVQQKFVKFMVGHNRYATRGSHTTEHAHPFRDGHITMVHNGTLDSFSHLPDAKDYKVDSEAVCHAFAVDGVEKTVKSLKGAWAFVWWDNKLQTINFLRNGERPLWLAPHQTDKACFFASEGHMLQWILQRNTWHYKEIKQLPENQWWAFSLHDEKPVIKELKGAKTTYYNEAAWEAWKEAKEMCSTDHGVASDTNVIPIQKKQTPAANNLPVVLGGAVHKPGGQNGTVNTSDKRGYLLSKKQNPKGSSSSGTIGVGSWVSVEHLHELSTGDLVTFWPENYKIIETDLGKKQGLYRVRGFIDDLPDCELYCNVKGEEALLACMEAPEGMRAQVVSIMRSMNEVAKNPHKIHLVNPEPMYVVEPTEKEISNVG